MRKMSLEEFKTVFKIAPRVTIDTVIRDRRGVLLVKRDIPPWKGRWHFPGGTVYFKEDLKHAAKRKAREETGLQVEVKKFVGIIEFIKHKGPGYGHILDVVFLCKPLRGNIRGTKFGKHLKFFKKIPNNMIPEQRKILQHMRRGLISLHIMETGE